MIYLDHNATTRPLPEVLAAVSESLATQWGNPSSRHPLGEAARRSLNAARAEVAALVGAQPVEVVFTSGATESNHQVLHGVLHRPGMPRRILLSAIEHSGYLKSALRLRQDGVEVELIPVDPEGRIDLAALQELLKRDAALVSVMAANNETGVLQPVSELCALVRARGIPVHVDATQMAGKLPVTFSAWGVDLLSISAHKLHGPKGVGALIVRKGLNWPSLLAGQQERARRGGTENVPGIVGFGVAARQARAVLAEEAAREAALRSALEARLAVFPGLQIHGAGAERLPNTVCFTVAGCSSEKLLGQFERAGIYASSGAACSSGGSDPSHVLLAMGVAPERALGAVRLSLGLDTQAGDLDAVLDVLRQTLTAAAPACAPAH